MDQTRSTTSPPLLRGIGRVDLLALTMNSIVGAGIFGLPSKVFTNTGAYSPFVYVACALAIGVIILCFSEVASRFSGTGGPYVYAREAFGSMIGFEIGWLMWLARVTGFAAVCNLLMDHLSYFLPAAHSGTPRMLLISGILLSLTGINVVGVRLSVLVSNVLTVSKLLPLLVFVAVGLVVLDTKRITFGVPPSTADFSRSVLLLVFAFAGFESAAVPGGETERPRRSIPTAMLTALAVVTTLYLAIQVVCIGTVPDLARSSTPLADGGREFLGPIGGAFITAAAIVSIGGNIGVGMLVAPRLPFAMAAEGQLPKILARTHPRLRTPYVAIVFSAAAMLLTSLVYSFIEALTISTMIRLLTYAATCAALPVLRIKKGVHAARFTAPGGWAVAGLGLVLCSWLLAQSAWQEARDVGIAAALGLLVLLVHTWCKGFRGPATSPLVGTWPRPALVDAGVPAVRLGP